MAEKLFINLYIKRFNTVSTGAIEYIRAYKNMKPKKDATVRFSHFVYSYKAKRYVEAYFYVFEFDGSQVGNFVFPDGMLRSSLRRIGLDIR